MIDVHNHMLPQIDDGAADWECSMEMARIAANDGIEAVICTPHWVRGCYENSRELIMEAVTRLQERLDAEGIALRVYPGSELHLDFDLSRKLEEGEVITLNDTGRYALVELPADILPHNLRGFFWDLSSLNITPVLSHPERNCALQRDPARLYRWVEMGVLTQVTAASITGRFGSQVQNFTHTLLKHHLVHAVASDAHSPRARKPVLSKAFDEVSRLMGQDTAETLFIDHPQKILLGDPIEPPQPMPLDAAHSRSSFRKIFELLGLSSKRVYT